MFPAEVALRTGRLAGHGPTRWMRAWTLISAITPVASTAATASLPKQPQYFGFEDLRSRLSLCTADDCLFITDFDLTLTSGDSQQCHDIVGESPLLPSGVREQFERLLDFSKPFPPELAGNAWWSAANEILLASGASIRRECIARSVREANIRLRPGAAQLLQQLYDSRVPVLIVSAGFADVVEIVLAEELEPKVANWCAVSSNRLVFDGPTGELTSIEPADEPYTSYNKDCTYTRNLAWFEVASQSKRNHVFVVGDKLTDLKVTDGVPPGELTRIGIGIVNDVEDGGSAPASLDEYRSVYDAVLCGDHGSFDVLTDLVRGLTCDE